MDISTLTPGDAGKKVLVATNSRMDEWREETLVSWKTRNTQLTGVDPDVIKVKDGHGTVTERWSKYVKWPLSEDVIIREDHDYEQACWREATA